MKLKISAFILVTLIIISFYIGVYIPFFTDVDVDKKTFEETYMPIMATCLFALPFLCAWLLYETIQKLFPD